LRSATGSKHTICTASGAIHVGRAGFHAQRAGAPVDADGIVGTVCVRFTVGDSAIATFKISVADKLAATVFVVSTIFAEATISRDTHLTILGATAGGPTDEVGADVALAEIVGVDRVWISVNIFSFACQETHHQVGRLERPAHLADAFLTFPFGCAAICVGFALVGAVTLVDAVETNRVSGKVPFSDIGKTIVGDRAHRTGFTVVGSRVAISVASVIIRVVAAART
jgi:hypothetical protein